MERGEIGPISQHTFMFVFEGLIAEATNPRIERSMIQLHRWRRALDLWTFNIKACDWMRELIGKGYWVVVLTWHPKEFAQQLNDYLWSIDVCVGEVKATRYEYISHRVATDSNVLTVYDPHPDHRFGYGYKCREFYPTLGVI